MEKLVNDLKIKDSYILLLFVLIFTLLFVQFPLNDSFAGNCDTLIGIARFNFYLNKIKSFFFHDYSNFLYPEMFHGKFGETVHLLSLPYIFFRIIGFGDVLSYYFFLVLIFSINSYTLFKLSKFYFTDIRSSFFAAIVFSLSNFTFGHIDDPHIIFFGFAFLALINFHLFLETHKIKYFFYLTLLSIIQINSSAYNYFSLLLLLFCFSTFNWTKMKPKKKFFQKSIALFILVNLIFGISFFFSNIKLLGQKDFYNPWNNRAISNLHSFISLGDFFKKLPGNIYKKEGDVQNVEEESGNWNAYYLNGYQSYIYPFPKDTKFKFKVPPKSRITYHQLRRSGFLGFSTLLLLLIGILNIRRLKGKGEILSLFFIGLLFSFGPLILINNTIIKTPLFPFYEYFDFIGYFRVPTRIFFLSLFSIALLCGHGLNNVLSLKKLSLGFKNILMIGIISIFLLENCPTSFKKYRHQPTPLNLFSVIPKDSKDTILHLPSEIGLLFSDDTGDFFNYSREFIYMNWHNYHKKKILNGASSYYSKTRALDQNYIDKIPQENSLKYLSQKRGVKYIAIHPHLILNPREKLLIEKLKKSPFVKVINSYKENILLKLTI